MKRAEMNGGDQSPEGEAGAQSEGADLDAAGLQPVERIARLQFKKSVRVLFIIFNMTKVSHLRMQRSRNRGFMCVL